MKPLKKYSKTYEFVELVVDDGEQHVGRNDVHGNWSVTNAASTVVTPRKKAKPDKKLNLGSHAVWQ